MAKALLIKPTNSHFDRSHLQVNFEPLGLMCLSAFVKKYSAHEVVIIDAQVQSSRVRRLGDGRFRMGMDAQEIAAAVREHQPGVVGISCLFERLEDDVLDMARAIKAASRQVKVVLGGMDASIRFERYLGSGVVDLVVVGAGEETLLDILNAHDAGQGLSGIAGTVEITGEGGCRKNAQRVARIPFDEHPCPDRGALPRRYYDRRVNQRRSYPFSRSYPAMLIQSSRGCRMRCVFCEIISVYDSWQGHSPSYVVKEMEECIAKYGTREFIFLDDNFMMDPKRVVEICDLIIAKNLKISIDILAGMSVWTLTEDIIDRMARAGLYRVCLPIESGNPGTLEFVQKPIDLEKAKALIDHCNRIGLFTFANLIIGFPFETREDIERTIAWGRTSGLDAVNYFVAQPMRGSRMYSVYESHGWITDDAISTKADYSWQKNSTWRTENFTSEQLGELAGIASTRYILERIMFYLSPAAMRPYLLPKIASFEKLAYAFRVGFYLWIFSRKTSSSQRVVNLGQMVKRRFGKKDNVRRDFRGIRK